MSTSRKQIVGKYELGKVLASGYFDGRTRICTHIVTGAQYVVRIYNKAVLAEAEWIWNRTREAIQVMRTMPKHENIIETTECFETQTSLYILMQLFSPMHITKLYTNGNSAGQRVTIPLAKTKHYYKQIVYGLLHMHNHNVVHLGLAPDHIMVNDRDQVKIGYLVSCMRCSKGKLCNEMRGTTHTVAPEVLNNAEYDPYLADAWSMGILLYFMLHQGHYPHDSANTTKNIKYHRIRSPDPRLSSEAKDILARLLHPISSRRMRVEQILSHPFFAVEEEEENDGNLEKTTTTTTSNNNNNNTGGGNVVNVTDLTSASSTAGTSYGLDLVTGQDTVNIRIPHGLSRQEEAAYIIQQTYRAYRLRKQRQRNLKRKFFFVSARQNSQTDKVQNGNKNISIPLTTRSSRSFPLFFQTVDKGGVEERLPLLHVDKRQSRVAVSSLVEEMSKISTPTNSFVRDCENSFSSIIRSADKEDTSMEILPTCEFSLKESNTHCLLRNNNNNNNNNQRATEQASFSKLNCTRSKENTNCLRGGISSETLRAENMMHFADNNADSKTSLCGLPKIKVDATQQCPLCHRIPTQRTTGTKLYPKTRFVYKKGDFHIKEEEEEKKNELEV